MRRRSIGWSLILLSAITGLNFPTPVSAFQQLNQKLRVDIEHHRGFERVTMATRSGKPVAEDHVFRVVSRNSYYGNNGQVYSKTITIPRGKSSATVDLYVRDTAPNNWSTNYLHIEQDGNERYDARDLMITQANSRNNNYYNFPSTLFISSTVSAVKTESYICSGRSRMTNVGASSLSINANKPLPSFFELEPLFVQCGELVQGAVTDSKSLLQAVSSIESMEPANLPGNWKGMAAYELAIISYKDLVAVAQSDDDARQALMSWVTAGGTLVVSDTGKSFQKSPMILPMLTGQPAGAPANKNTRWMVPSPEIRKLSRFALDSEYYIGPNQPQITISLNDTNIGRGQRFLPLPQKPDAATQAPFAICSFVNGHIIAVPDDMQGWKLKDWQTLYNSHQLFDSSINKIIGTSALASLYESGFSIPGVGQPPVIAFQVLVGLFVLVVGPGFYFFLYQSGRLHLMLIIAPVLSLLACLGLFLYAIINDGFDIRGRVHSVTRIDHPTGAAITHARHAYYAGISPQGYAFDRNTAVFDTRRDNSSATVIRYRNDDGFAISGGELKARNPHQLVSVRSFQTNGRLSVDKIPAGPDEAQRYQIQNQFQSNVQLAIVRINQQWLIAEDVAPGATVLANPLSMRDLKSKLRTLVRTHSPHSRDRLRRNNRLNYWNGYNANNYEGQSDSMIKSFRNGNLNVADIDEGGYIAVMQQFNELPDPQPQALYDQNRLHIVIGKW